MILYTLEQLNSDVQAAFNKYHSSEGGFVYSEPYYSFFFILNRYGLRFNEAKNGANFIRLSDTQIKVPLSKGQDHRILNESPEIVDRLLYVIRYFESFSFVNNTTASRLLNRFLQKEIALDTGKFITTHLFRHKLCKNLHASGLTIAQISDYIGEINRANVAGYINSSLYYRTLRN